MDTFGSGRHRRISQHPPVPLAIRIPPPRSLKPVLPDIAAYLIDRSISARRDHQIRIPQNSKQEDSIENWLAAVANPEKVILAASARTDDRARGYWSFGDSVAELAHYVTSVKNPETPFEYLVVIHEDWPESREWFEWFCENGAMVALDELFGMSTASLIQSEELDELLWALPAPLPGIPPTESHVAYVGDLPESEYDKLAFFEMSGFANSIALTICQPKNRVELGFARIDLFKLATFGRVRFPKRFVDRLDEKGWPDGGPFDDFIGILLEHVPKEHYMRSKLYCEFSEIRPKLVAAEAVWRRFSLAYPDMLQELEDLVPHGPEYLVQAWDIAKRYGVCVALDTVYAGIPLDDVIPEIARRR